MKESCNSCSFLNRDSKECSLGLNPPCGQFPGRKRWQQVEPGYEFEARQVRIPESRKKHIKKDGRN